MTVRSRILVFGAHYLPGEKAGGSVRSLAGLVEALREEIDFRVVTSDRDLGEKGAYSDIETDRWIERDGVPIIYLSRRGRSALGIARLLREIDYDLIYLNSFFSRRFSMLPVIYWRIGLARQVPLILAPRGEFNPGALAIRRRRKTAYLAFSRKLHLYSAVLWHASSSMEKRKILHVLEGGEIAGIDAPVAGNEPESGDDVPEGGPVIMVALDFAKRTVVPLAGSWPAKEKGELRIVFLSRISPVKNLDGALRMLRGLRGDVRFTIFGPLEDTQYWSQCEDLMRTLDRNVQVRYGGIVAHVDVADIFLKADLFFFPTLGENFGHVIAEALFAGCPILTSDQTPWRGLEAMRAGWDFPLGEAGRFKKVLQECVDMGPEEFESLRVGALEHGLRYLQNNTAVEEHRNLFVTGLRSGGRQSDSRS